MGKYVWASGKFLAGIVGKLHKERRTVFSFKPRKEIEQRIQVVITQSSDIYYTLRSDKDNKSCKPTSDISVAVHGKESMLIMFCCNFVIH